MNGPILQQLEPRLLLSIPGDVNVPGDVTGNGFVDDADIAVLIANWEQDPEVISNWGLGDLTGDTDVDGSDLNALLGNWTGGPGYYRSPGTDQDLPDPIARDPYANYSHLPLWVDGAQYDDAVQGIIGDCWLAAAVSSLAQASPEMLEESIIDLGDGTYGVRFYDWYTQEEIWYRVDADLPQVNGTPTYASITPDGELWVALLEKAFIQYRGYDSYSRLDGGYMGGAYAALTGEGYDTIVTSTMTNDDMGVYIEQSLAAGHAVSVGSDGLPGQVVVNPILGAHAYAVHSIEEVDDEWFVTVYNPRGDDSVVWDDNFEDGLLRLSMDVFQQAFVVVCTSRA